MDKYYNNQYALENYVEGDDSQPIINTEHIVTISRSFVLDGTDITDHVTSANVYRENGKAFHTITLTLKNKTLSPLLVRNKNKRLVVTIGTDSYSTIIIDSDVNSVGDSEIIAKTDGCLLDFPFTPESNDTFAGTSNTIIQTLVDKCGVNCHNTLPDFPFNKGSFILNGSHLSGIEELVAVSGGTIFEVNNTLMLTEAFYIPDGATPTFIANNDLLTDKQFSDNIDGSGLVKKVIFNPRLSEVESIPLVTMVKDDDKPCRRPVFLLNPEPSNMAEINSNLGEMSFTITTQTFEDTLLNDSLIRLGGAIDSIIYVTLDGEEFSDYSYEYGHNVMLFTTEISGVIKVRYSTKSIVSYTKNGSYNSADNTYNYKVQYLTQLLNVDVPKCDTGDTDSGGDNNSDVDINTGCRVITNSTVTKDTPLVVEIVQGTLNKAIFVEGGTDYPRAIFGASSQYKAVGNFDTSFIADVVVNLNVTKLLTLTGTMRDVTEEINKFGSTRYYGVIVPKDIVATEIMVGNSAVMLQDKTFSSKGYRIYYTSRSLEGATVTLTYQGAVDRYTFPPCGANNPVKYVDLYVCNTLHTISYPTDSDIDDDPTNITECSLPANVTVNVAKLLNEAPEAISGAHISDGATSYVITSNGKTIVTIDEKRVYTFDTSHLRSGSSIIIDSTNAKDTP